MATVQVTETNFEATHQGGGRSARLLGLLVRTVPRLRAGLRGGRPGVLPSAAIEKFIGKVQALDMTEVRQRLEAQQAKTEATRPAGIGSHEIPSQPIGRK